jgi:photosystem II stability/assembly factor-like uncharacterized protein
MKTPLRCFLMCMVALLPLLGHGQPFKHKYYDPSVNVNALIAEADAWYAAHGTGPGKGWKGYQRWRYEFEHRFYPTGDRSQFDPQTATREYAQFKATQSTAKGMGTLGHWTFRGPSSASNILPPNWAAGLGRIEAVWGGAATPDTVYLGSRSGGFWKTVDGGTNWHSTTQDLPAMGVVDIEVHPDRHNEVWIVTRHAAGYSYGLLKSTDFGETWGATGLTYTPQQAYAGEMVMASADTFFVATNGGIQRSTDGGVTWAGCYSGNMITIVGHPTNSQILYAFDSNSMSQLRRTTNGGQTWSNFNVSGNSGYPFVATTAAAPDYVYVGSGSGIFKSTDQGSTWANISIDPTNSGIMTLGVSATQPDHIYAGSLNQYVSTDGGANWSVFADWVSYFGANYVHADMRVFRAWGNRIYTGTDGFLGYSSDNGATWNKINQGTGVREFYRIGCSVMDAEDIVGGSQDNGTSAMLDGVWYEWIGADGMQSHFDYNNPDIWFGTIQNGSLQRTNQGGQNAEGVSPSANGNWITPSVIDPSNENTIFMAFDTLFKSNDNGDTWQTMSGFLSGNFDEIAIAPSDSNVLYISRASVIRRSTDNGRTWTFINTGLPNQFINRIAVHPDDPMQVALCMSGFNGGNKVFASTNGGTSWSNLSGNLPNLPANALAWTAGPPVRLLLGMDVGVYHADAGTSTWTLYADSLPAVVINDLEVLEGAGLIRVGTWGRGAWEAPIPGRAGKPQIVKVMMDPVSFGVRPKPADTVEITAVIRNLGGIQSAVLRWGTTTAAQPNQVAMQLVQGDTFRAEIPALPEGTHVYYRITGTAPNGDSARTERLMYMVKAAIPCAAAGSAGTSFDFIDTVRVASLNNASGQDYYGDFRSTYTPLYRDSSYVLMTSLNYSFALDSMFLWVDWNHDGDFVGTEQVVMSNIDGSHNSYGSFTVPHIAVIPDTVVLRVRCMYGNNLVADPCNNYFGEVEDYSIVVTDSVVVGLAGALASGIVVAPNPASTEVRIWRSPSSVGPMTVRLLDLQGRAVRSPITTEQLTCTIDLAGLAQGIYVVEVWANGMAQRTKLQVVRD